jgi:hypothetical protein
MERMERSVTSRVTKDYLGYSVRSIYLRTVGFGTLGGEISRRSGPAGTERRRPACRTRSSRRTSTSHRERGRRPTTRPWTTTSLRSSAPGPSAKNFRYRPNANARGQLAIFIDAEGKEDEGSHCYYRLAGVSNRLEPVNLTIRGYDFYPGTPLLLGTPLEGIARGEHIFSYLIQGRPVGGGDSVVLSVETCVGNLRTVVRRDGPEELTGVRAKEPGRRRRGTTRRFACGMDELPLSLSDSSWLEVSSEQNTFGSNILTVEDSQTRVWLEPRPSRRFAVKQIGLRGVPRRRLARGGRRRRGRGGRRREGLPSADR